MRILIVEDDVTTLDGLRNLVQLMGHEPLVATSARDSLRLLTQHSVDLVLLDMILSDGRGTDVLKGIKGMAKSLPVLMLTSINDLDVKLETFEFGVEDYVVKPFDARELMARINVILRRTSPRALVADGKTRYDEVDKVLSAGRVSVALTLNEDRLFRALVAQPNQAVSKSDLYQKIWGERRVGVRNLDTLVNYLRKKIEPTGLEIRSIYGVGYMLAADEKGTPE